MEQIASLLPLIAIALIFWLLILRPASRRQKEVVRLQSSLKPGDRVLLSSGLYATLRSVQDDRVQAEIADGVVVQVARGAVAAVDPDGTQGASSADGTDGASADRPDEPGTQT